MYNIYCILPICKSFNYIMVIDTYMEAYVSTYLQTFTAIIFRIKYANRYKTSLKNVILTLCSKNQRKYFQNSDYLSPISSFLVITSRIWMICINLIYPRRDFCLFLCSLLQLLFVICSIINITSCWVTSGYTC